MDMRSFLSVKRPRVEGVVIYRDIVYANEEAVPSLGSDWLDDTVSQPAHHGNFDPSRDSVEEYDFLELLELVGHHHLVIKEKRQHGQTLDTAPLIQNELNDIQGCLIHSYIYREARDAGIFSIMADESRELSKHEQVAINVLYWMNGRVREAFHTISRAHYPH